MPGDLEGRSVPLHRFLDSALSVCIRSYNFKFLTLNHFDKSLLYILKIIDQNKTLNLLISKHLKLVQFITNSKSQNVHSSHQSFNLNYLINQLPYVPNFQIYLHTKSQLSTTDFNSRKQVTKIINQ